MKKKSYILAIDQGTTSSRAIIFDENYKTVANAQKEFPQYFPRSGWVEHDATEIWESVLKTCRSAIEQANISAKHIAGIGITNQRETIVMWDKKTGTPLHNALVKQERRTADQCNSLKKSGHEDIIRQKTGLILDPYFSATKISWLLNHVDGLRTTSARGDILCGTIDSYLLWKLTNGRSHKTDVTNASRTSLYNIHDQAWDEDLLNLFQIPQSLLPETEECAAHFGETDATLFGATIPILGIAGDQHAATIGQACFKKGMIKATYGTGCFMMLNTGDTCQHSDNRLLSTIAYKINGKVTYAIEGSVFIAGAIVQWLRDGLGIIDHASQVDNFAQKANDTQNVMLIPAFAGLGAPYWEPNVRGTIFGLDRGTGVNEICRAALDSICFQSRDLLEAMSADLNQDISSLSLRVDGGMTKSDWTMQRLSDITNIRVERPQNVETTALGAAWLAGYKSGVWGDQNDFSSQWHAAKHYAPQMEPEWQTAYYEQWQKAVQTLLKQ